MCELCSEDTVIKAAASKALTRTAVRLENLASQYRAVASGEICRNSDKFQHVGPTAKAVVRDLVETWV